ncbi:MAG: hypothetical protein IJW30_05595 [Clostridia bacterium]|nr:hypothetical protein [Clostridia bacterium]
MKKRLICMCLCLVTLLSLVLTGCSETTDEENLAAINAAESRGAYTLTMWIVSENKVDEETCAEITAEINNLTQTKHKTKLVIKYFTAEEYYDALSESLAAYSASSSGSVAGSGVDMNDDGLYQEVYPALQENQVDILYIGDLEGADGELLMSGEEMYRDLVSKGHLAEMDSYLKASAVKKIYEYVSPTLMEAVKENDITYALPTNDVIGDYTYMLINKELMDAEKLQGHFLDGSINGFYNEYVYRYLNKLLASNPAEGTLLPVDATYEECLALLAHYWSVDPEAFDLDSDAFSIFGSQYGDVEKLTRGEAVLGTASLFEDPAFVSAYLQLNKYRLEEENFFRNASNSDVAYDNVAIKFIEGDLDILTFEEDIPYYYEGDECYYVVPVKYPSVSEEDLYDNMFGVCVYSGTEQVRRSMEILTYLNTDAEIRNLLQYGIEGEHYNMIGGEVVRGEKGDRYQMDLFATGNAFIAYPEAWISDTAWDNGKIQNGEALIEPLLGFDLSAYAESLSIATPFKDPTDNPYQLSYVTGLSKDALSSDLLLKAWIESCDEKAEGVYVYNNSVKGTNETTSTFYVYNTLGESDLKLQTSSVINQTNKKVIGLDITLAYDSVYTTDSSALGYELSIVSYTCPKDYTGQLRCTVDGKSTPVTIKARDRSLNVDLLNTDNYAIDVYTDLTLAHFYGQDEIYNQLMAWKETASGAPVNYVLTWRETDENGVTYVNYVVYRENLTTATSVSVYPIGGAKNPSLKFQYTDYAGTAVGAGYRDYVLTYVRVAANDGVTVGVPTFVLNDAKDSARTVTVTSEALDFDLMGALDTDLVKYANALNAQISDLLASCTTYEELEAVVADLVILLSTKTAPTVEMLKSEAVLAAVADENGAIKGDLEALYRNVRHMTSSRTLKEIDSSVSGKVDGLNEDRVFLYSPFGIYQKWLTENKFGEEEEKKDDSASGDTTTDSGESSEGDGAETEAPEEE